MPRSLYRYRPIHALSEALLARLAPLIPGGDGSPLSKPPQRVLIIKFGGMGEAVLARSLVECLRARNPSMSFDYLVESRTAEVMTLGAPGRKILYSPRSDDMGPALGILRRIRALKYEAVLDFEQHSLLTAGFARASSIPVRVGFAPPDSGPRSHMFTHPVPLRETESMWSSFIRVAQVLDPDLPAASTTVPLPYPADTEDWLDQWWRSHAELANGGPAVAMHIGVGPSAQYRRWPAERFAHLAKMMAGIQPGLTVILTGSPEEQPILAEFRTIYSGRTVDASGLGGIARTAALMRRCDLVVSNDTGLMHLGAAMGTPTVGLFGASNPTWWAPVGPRATYVYTSSQPCSPCINSYLRHIPETCTAAKSSACMWDIEVQHVLDAARRVVVGDWLSKQSS